MRERGKRISPLGRYDVKKQGTLLLFSFFLFMALVEAPIVTHSKARAGERSATSQELTDLKVAVGAYEDGLYKIASDYFKNFLKKYPRSKFRLRVSILLAKSLRKMGKKDEALKTYLSILQTRNIQDTETLLQLHYALYELFWEKGAEGKALSHLKFIVDRSVKKKTRSPTSYKAFLTLSEYYKRKNRLVEAKRLLDKLLLLHPPSPWRDKALLQKIVLLSLNGRYEEISALLEPVIKNMKGLEGDNKTLYLYWALSNVNLKRYCLAQKAYSKLLKAYSDSPTLIPVLTGYIISSYNCFADEHVRSQMFRALRKQFKNRPSILFQVDYLEGLLNFQEKKYAKSKTVWTKTLERFPDHPKIPEILLKLDKVFKNLNDINTWESLLIRIYKGKKYLPETKEIASLLLGNLYFRKGKYETALPFYFSIISKKKFRKFCLKRIVFCYYYLGKFKEAKTNLGILLLENPHMSEQADILFLRSDLLLRLNKTEDALPFLKKLAHISSKDDTQTIWKRKATLELGKLYFLRGDFKNAKRYLLDVFKRSSSEENNREAAFYLGLIAYQEKNLELAETYFQIASLAQNPKVRLEALFRLGCVTRELKSYSESVKIFQEIIKHYPSQNKWHQLSRLELAEIYIAKHDYKNANSLLKSLISTTKDEELKKRAIDLLRRINKTDTSP